jgi:DHA2 family multidrug resistance protein-like MFS transporter
MGTLGDRIGRRRLLMIGAAAFGAVSLLAAFATSAETLIAARLLLGVAGATIAPSTLSLIFHMFRDARQRSLAVGVWIGAFSAGSAVGPVLGGRVLASHRWGAVFLLALPVMAALLVLGARGAPGVPRSRRGAARPALGGDVDRGRARGRVRDQGGGRARADGRRARRGGPRRAGRGGVGAAPAALGRPDDRRAAVREPAVRRALLVNRMAFFVMVGDFLFFAQYLQLVARLSPPQAGCGRCRRRRRSSSPRSSHRGSSPRCGRS